MALSLAMSVGPLFWSRLNYLENFEWIAMKFDAYIQGFKRIYYMDYMNMVLTFMVPKG